MTTRFDSHLAWIDQQQARLTQLLQVWACINTGTYNLAGLTAFASLLCPALQQLGGDLREIPLGGHSIISDDGTPVLRPLGNVLSMSSTSQHPPAKKCPRALLAIHYDTVFSADHPFQSASLIDDSTLRGPGVCDAKGGLLVLLFALLALERSPHAGKLQWEILLNPDEEIGSPGSAPLFVEAARRNDLALLFEPALPDGALVSARKGSGNYTIIVRGRAAHAGRDASAGRNAIDALASLILRVSNLPQDIPGIIVNTGFVHGGGPVNIVPDLALCRVNIRVDTAAQQKAVETALNQFCNGVGKAEGLRAELHGGFSSPPKPLTPPTQDLLHHFQECGAQLDLPLAWRATGGACDGNRISAAVPGGLPTVDSLGVRGGNIHTADEFVALDSLVERTRLVALFLMRLAAGEIIIGPVSTHAEVA